MPKGSLRAYNREIENLIDRGQTEEAVAHCKYILKQLPKHLDTYRLLGKAFLESQRYTEAADIFQRVLVSIPDDFVAQLSMSIIREDEGNLDGAIWHMERAFEVQPSNSAIQDELRRLYGRRDGVDLPRIRLTRGALVRMYARGELFPQAIAEARAAIAEDPTRHDIEVVLARIYSQAGFKTEATELAGRLVSKMPFCYEAVRILAQVLPETTRADEAKPFQQLMVALEPYAAFLSSHNSTIDQVPENAVMVEQLEWQPEQAKRPDWAQTVGIDLETSLPDVPDWMDSVPVSPPPTRSSIPTPPPTPVNPLNDLFNNNAFMEESSDSPASSAAGDDSFPDWMNDAGWQPAEGDATAKDTSSAFSDESEATGSENPSPADIPDWLRSLAPSGSPSIDEPVEQVSADDQERLDFLNQILPSADQKPEEEPSYGMANIEDSYNHDEKSGEALSIEPPAAAQHDTFDWLTEETPDVPQEPAARQESSASLDWFDAKDNSSAPDTASSGEGAMPDWLQELSGPEPAAPQTEPENMPDWLQELGINDSTQDQSPAQSSNLDWLDEIVTPESSESAAPEWVNASDSQPPASPAAPESHSAQQPPAEPEQAQPEAAFPGWLDDLTTGDSGQVTADDQILPDWLQDLTTEAPAESEAPTPEWLQEIAVDTPAGNVTDQAPDWLQEIQLHAQTNEVDSSQGTDEWQLSLEETDYVPTLPPSAQAPASDAQPDEETELNAPTVQAEVPPTPPAQSPQPPSWVGMEAEPGQPVEEPAIQLESSAVQSFPLAEQPLGESPDDLDTAMAWLESLAARNGAEPEVLFSSMEERTDQPPDWVQESMQHPDAAPAAQFESSVPAETELPSEEAQIDQQPTEVLPSASIPEAVTEATPAQPVASQSVEPASDDLDAAMAWLETLAARQGAEPDELLVPPEERLETPPDWVSELAAQAEPESSEKVESTQPLRPVGLVEPDEETRRIELPGMGSERDLSWIEQIAAETDAEQMETPMELSSEPESSEVFPSWLEEAVKETAEPVLEDEPVIPGTTGEPAEEPIMETVQQTPAEIDLPDWLNQIAEEEPSEVAEGLPDWLNAIDLDAAGPQPVVSETAEEPQSLQEKETEAEPIPSTENDMPEWLRTVEAEYDSQTEMASTFESLPVKAEVPPEMEIEAPELLESRPELFGAQIFELAEESEPEIAESPASQPEPEIELEQPAMKEPVARQEPASQSTQPTRTAIFNDQAHFEAGKKALLNGQIDHGLDEYNRLIEEGKLLDEIIQDLRNALYRYPVDIAIWQSLGDAYLHSNRIQDALDSYTKAEELLR